MRRHQAKRAQLVRHEADRDCEIWRRKFGLRLAISWPATTTTSIRRRRKARDARSSGRSGVHDTEGRVIHAGLCRKSVPLQRSMNAMMNLVRKFVRDES